jgi:hypothetical protein
VEARRGCVCTDTTYRSIESIQLGGGRLVSRAAVWP